MTNQLVAFLILVQFVLAFTQPVVIVYLLLLIGAIPLTLQASDIISWGVGAMSVSTLRIFGLWLTLFIVITLNLQKTIKYVSIYKYHLVFLSFVFISIAWSPSGAYGFRMIAKITMPLMFMLVIFVTIHNVTQIKIIGRIIIISALISIGLAVVFQSLVTGRFFTMPGMSAATFSAHIVTVSMLVLASIVCEGKKLAFLIMAILVIAVLAAFTRITIGAMFIGASVMLFIGLRGVVRFALPSAGITGLAALFLLSDRFRNRMFMSADDISVSSIIDNPSAALDHLHGSGRFSAWENILEQFFSPSPLIGSGAGATQHYFYTHSVSGLGVIHSEYVRMLAEIGIIGLSLFILTFTVYIFGMLNIYRSIKGTEYAKYPLAASGALVTYIIFIATDNGFDYVLQFGNYVFALMALAFKARELLATDKISVMDSGDAKQQGKIAPRRLLAVKTRK